MTRLEDVDPLRVCGNAANLEYRTIRCFSRNENFFSFVLQIGCILTDVKGVYSKIKLLDLFFLQLYRTCLRAFHITIHAKFRFQSDT